MLKIRYEPDPVLRTPCATAEVESALQLGRRMLKCMRRAKGIGLAAPQVGVSSTLFVTHAPLDRPRIFINPVITQQSSDQVVIQEGCLSIPAIYYPVPRSKQIVVEAHNEEGNRVTIEADGMLARVILHEYDHLQGILFWDLLPKKVYSQLHTQYHH